MHDAHAEHWEGMDRQPLDGAALELARSMEKALAKAWDEDPSCFRMRHPRAGRGSYTLETLAGIMLWTDYSRGGPYIQLYADLDTWVTCDDPLIVAGWQERFIARRVTKEAQEKELQKRAWAAALERLAREGVDNGSL